MARVEEDRRTEVAKPCRLTGTLVTIHRCSECGRWEGAFPQAGCCPGCGRGSEALPFIVEVVGVPAMQP